MKGCDVIWMEKIMKQKLQTICKKYEELSELL